MTVIRILGSIFRHVSEQQMAAAMNKVNSSAAAVKQLSPAIAVINHDDDEAVPLTVTCEGDVELICDPNCQSNKVNANGDLGLHRFQSMVSTGFNVREDEEGEKSANNDLIIAEEGNTLSKA